MEMRQFFRSDLMEERQGGMGEGILSGVSCAVHRQNGIEIFETRVLNEEGARLTDKPIGCYLTLSFKEPWLMSDEEKDLLADAVAGQLRRLLDEEEQEEQKEKSDAPILLVGLGNRRMTADAVGPAVQSKILVTGHLKKFDPALFESLGQRAVCALAPGVLGDTGIESVEVVDAVAKTLKPAAILAVDALAAGSIDRLCRTVQLSDAGISPGAGVGNDRPGFSKEVFGIPVIAIGVPTVVDVSTLVANTFEKAGSSEIPPEVDDVLQRGRGFFVSLKEVDEAVETLSNILARAVDLAMERKGAQPLKEA